MASQNQLSINLGLSATPETANPELYSELVKVYNAINAVARTLDQYTGALQPDKITWDAIGYNYIRLQNVARIYPIFDEDASYGTLLAYNASGHAQKANATTTALPCKGYSSGPVTAGQRGEMILFGLAPFFTGLTPGTTYYLSTVAGLLQNFQPTTPGNIIQAVGWALDANTLFFNPAV